MLDPDVYNNSKNFNFALENLGKQESLIRKFNHRMSLDGYYDFLRINFD